MPQPTPQFTDLLTAHQQRMYRYVVSMLGEVDASWDVLQETNRVLLEKWTEFELGTNFAAWALRVAQFRTRSWIRDRGRDRLLVSPDLVAILADDADRISAEEDVTIEALERCLERLENGHRHLVHRRYTRSESLAEIAEESGRTVNALKQLFFRLRSTLQRCIESRLATESSHG